MTQTTADLEELWTTFCATRDSALRERMIVQYAPLVKYVVGRMAVSMPGVLGSEDIIGYGTVGLIQAVDRYDPTVGVKFETYAIRRIKGAILDAIRSLQQLSRDASKRARDLDHAYDELLQQHGRMPTNRELARHMGISNEELNQAMVDASLSVVSLSNPSGGDAGSEGDRPSLLEQIADEDTPGVEMQVERQQLYEALVQAIQALSERDRLVINLYYYEELTLKEISEVLGVSTSRVSQLHAAAVFKLRAALRANIAQPVAA
ncbi:MAG: FliA/WhiG family RNA polymerase sigma factor [Chloroflexi bacterium]|nr:FliA/WhiG family RNA polymerase sigma factor [Chloroflexota bacterium]